MRNADKPFLKKLGRKTPQGFFKLRNYFEAIIKSEKFQQEIKSLRDRYAIPKKGFYFNPETPYPIPPKNWQYKNDAVKFKEIIKRVKNLSKKFDLYESSWEEIFWDYLFYNEDLLGQHLLIYLYGLCVIEDIPEKITDLNDPNYKDIFKEIEKEELKGFPIAIRISPYATQRDILDFVKKNFKQINLLQKKYQKQNIKIAKIRNKSPQIKKRNQFIYEHRDLPRKDIMRLVSKKFNKVLDYGHIGKIISLEKKLRKEM